MYHRIFAAASALTLSAVYAQGAILANDSDGYLRTIYSRYPWSDDEEGVAGVDMIGLLVIGGEDDDQAYTTFDGEFEGLSPAPGIR